MFFYEFYDLPILYLREGHSYADDSIKQFYCNEVKATE